MHSTQAPACPVQPHAFPTDYDVSTSRPLPLSIPLQRSPLQPIFTNTENKRSSLDHLLNPVSDFSFPSSASSSPPTKNPSRCIPRLIIDSPDTTLDEVPSSSPAMVKLDRYEPSSTSKLESIESAPKTCELPPPKCPASSSSSKDTTTLKSFEKKLTSDPPSDRVSQVVSNHMAPLAPPNTPPPKSNVARPLAPKDKSQPPVSVHPPLSQHQYEKNRFDIEYLMKNDLRLGAIKSAFDSYSRGFHLNVISSMKQMYDCSALPFTFGEKVGLKELVSEDVPFDSVWPQFPLRTYDYMLQKHNEVSYTSKRKRHFKNATERLIYEAQWTVSDNPESLTRQRRRILNEHAMSDPQSKRQQKSTLKAARITPLPPKIPEASSPVHDRSRLKPSTNGKKPFSKYARTKNLPNSESKKPQNPPRLSEELPRRREGRIEKATLQREVYSKSSYYYGFDKNVDASQKQYMKKGALRDLLVASACFQAVTGNGEQLNPDQKRSRRNVVPATTPPETPFKLENRPPAIANARKNKLASVRRTPPAARKSRPTTEPKPKPKLETEPKPMVESGPKLEPEPEPEPEPKPLDDTNSFSSFSPPDISEDVLVPLNGRQLFTSEMYERRPTFRPVNEIVPSNRFSRSMQPIFDNVDDAHGQPDPLMIKDDLAHGIIKMHKKKYRSLPILFPPLFDPADSTKINTLNVINIRFLLYPQHYELFLLAEPKSNELDPIQEIIKIMMIHYALFFSHSESIKEIIIRDYCLAIEDAVLINDFALFLATVDKWNLLMLKLSPNIKAAREIENAQEDINSTVRVYLGESEKTTVLPQDLDLAHFHREIIIEEVSPKYDPILAPLSDLCLSSNQTDDENAWAQPPEYVSSFTSRLCEKKDISRFAVQQILMRVYARIVSTDSRKLRSYKAFTAEVYGELLPSFTSEVLEKVNLQPLQKFYDLGSGVGNTVLQAALEFGCELSGGCELMGHASRLAYLQQKLLDKHMALFGLKPLTFNNALLQSFVNNQFVREAVLNCDVLIINNYLFDVNLNSEVGRLLFGLKTGTKIISLRNFIRPRYKALGDTIFDRLKVEKQEMTEYMLVSWTANKVPYYISTVMPGVLPEYLGKLESPDPSDGSSLESIG